MQRPIKRGAAANAGLIFHIFASDSTSTTGAGKASVAFGSWSCRYIRNGEALSGAITPEDITTIGTYVAPTANTNIRIKAVDNTNAIGIYEIQIHLDWANTTNNCQSLTIYFTASGVAPLSLQILLWIFDPQDSVRGGLTALPNAAAEAAGGLYTRGSGAGQINQSTNGQVDVTIAPGQIIVKKNVALSNFPFPMYDSADHVTPKTGATVTAERSIDGAAFAAMANSVVEVGSGAYKINLAASDVNGNTIMMKFTAAGTDTLFISVVTQP
jgi:hypothetical protein